MTLTSSSRTVFRRHRYQHFVQYARVETLRCDAGTEDTDVLVACRGLRLGDGGLDVAAECAYPADTQNDDLLPTRRAQSA